MNNLFLALLLICGASAVWWLTGQQTESKQASYEEQKILYWVAPMDPNFRRPEPGKSPMGMDLVPVYANDGQEKGVVEISPVIENNISVRIAQVEKGNLKFRLQASGELTSAPQNRWHIHSRTEGWVEQIAVDYVGQKVKEGARLYAIYSPELVDAKEDFVRAVRSKVQQQIKAAQLRLNALQVDEKVISGLKNNHESPVDNLTWYFAPQDSVVETLNINHGMFVKPEQTLMSLVDYQTLWLLAELPASQSIPVAQSEMMEFEVQSQDIPGKFWKAKLDYFYPEINRALRTQTIRFIIDNNNRALHAGMWMTLSGEITSSEQVLLVPKEAVIRAGDSARVVLALGGGKFKSVAVVLGRSDDNYFEVLSGLEDGDKVVTSAQFLLDSESMQESDLKRLNSSHPQAGK